MFVLGPKRVVLAIVLLMPLVVVPRLRAQVPNAPQQNTPAREEASDDPLGRSTPHGAVLGFIRAAGRGDYDQAASYLNTTQRGELARKLAQQLQVILDRETSIDLSKLSRQPQGRYKILCLVDFCSTRHRTRQNPDKRLQKATNHRPEQPDQRDRHQNDE